MGLLLSLLAFAALFALFVALRGAEKRDSGCGTCSLQSDDSVCTGCPLAPGAEGGDAWRAAVQRLSHELKENEDGIP